MVNQTTKIDPIRKNYYRPLEQAETLVSSLFWIVAFLSILALIVNRIIHPLLYSLIEYVFVIGVLIFFLVGVGIRVYLRPRAEDKRRQDLLSHSFSIPLTHEQTKGYYNNQETESWNRLALSLLENSFFSKKIALKMANNQRVKTIIYLITFVFALLCRKTDLVFLALIAQTIFAEEILSRSIRLEWLRMRFEDVYDRLYQLIQADFGNDDKKRIRILEILCDYETGKAYGGIILSSKIFEQLNESLSQEWKKILKTLNS